MDKRTGGDIYIKGQKVNPHSPQEALRHGIGLISENRKTEGFVPIMSNAMNMALASLSSFYKGGRLNQGCLLYTSIRCLQPQVIYSHGTCCPNHSDETFQYHHIVESIASLTFALHSTGNDRRLCGVETRKNTTGYRDEKDRNKVVRVKIDVYKRQVSNNPV